MKDLNPKLVDKRTAQRNIRLGHLKEEEYQKFVKALPDDSSEFDEIPYEEPEDLEDLPLPDLPPSSDETPTS